MGIVGAFLLFFLFILVYIMIAEIFTVLFGLTGLTEDKAKFQVISMLTNSGYTTQESEVIATSKVRRKLARVTMVFGYAFTVTIVSAVVNIFMAFKKNQMQNVIWVIGILACFIMILFFLKRSEWVKKAFDKTIERIGNRLMFGKQSNPVVILDSYGGVVMAEVLLTHMPRLLQNTTLQESGLKETYNIMVLLIKRNGVVIEKIKGETMIQKGDTLVLFGARKLIRMIFERVEKAETVQKRQDGLC